MRRKPVHLAAAIAESLRFFAIAFLAYSVGALGTASVSSLLRYAAAPQVLFALGFFFLWLEPERCASYRPLLIVGKAAGLLCYLPLGSALAVDPAARGISLGRPALGLGLALLIAAADMLSLTVLFLTKAPEPSGPGTGPAAEPPKPAGQGPDEIERVEA